MFSDVDLRRMTLDENTGRRRDSNRDWQLIELSAGQRKTVISERAMTFVAREVGDLMEVGKIVGFNEGRFRQFQSSCPHPNSQISSIFFCLALLYGHTGHRKTFVRLLREVNVDDEHVRKVITKEYPSDDSDILTGVH